MCIMAYATNLKSIGLLIGLFAERIVGVVAFSVKTFMLDITKEIEDCKERLEKEQERTMETDILVKNEISPSG